MLPPKHENYSKQGTFTDFLKGFDSKPDTKVAGKKPATKKHRRQNSQGSESDFDAKSVTSSIRSSLSGTVKSEEVGDFPLPGELSPGNYENATPPTPPTISQFPKKKKKAVSPPQLQPKLKKSKVPKDANTSPLTVIGGKYSFNMDTEGAENVSDNTLGSQHAANGKPLYPSLQTAMRPQNQTQSQSGGPQSSKKSPPELKSAKKSENQEQNRKLSLKEKRKLRAERAELQPLTDLAANKNNLTVEPTKPVEKSPNKSSESESISPNNTVKTGTEDNGNNGVLMRTTSREFAVSRALGKYREKQKKQQKQRNSVGSNSDSQEDLDLVKTPTPKTSPPRISMIDEFEEEIEQKIEKSSDTDESPLRVEEVGDQLEAASSSGAQSELQSKVLVPESSSSEEVLKSSEKLEITGEQLTAETKNEEYYQKEAEKATQQAEKAAQEAAIKAEKAAKQAATVAKSAFGLFGASKFGKFAQQAAQAAQQTVKESQQKISAPPSRTSSALGSGSRRQSTEESIDTDDEWYRHEIRELEQEQHEKIISSLKPSESVTSKMNHVFIELTATVPRIEAESCVAHDRAMRAKQNTFGPPPRPTESSFTGIEPMTSSDEDHKKVIMRFQSSGEEDEMMEDEESSEPAQQLDAKKKASHGLRGRGANVGSESSENEGLIGLDSDATQSGPDSLMEDTGGSSENILEKHSASATASEAAKKPSDQKSSSSGGSRKSKKSVKSPLATGGGATSELAASTEAAEATEGQEEYNEDEYYNEGGYYDENGDWVESGGYYDENGDWVETGGYYDESGEWVEYAGYYDDNGEWVDVELPEHMRTQEYYDDGGGGGEVGDPPPPDPAGPQDDPQNTQAGHFLANRGVAVFPQTQTAPRQKHPNGHLETGGTSFEDTLESSTEVGDDDEDNDEMEDETPEEEFEDEEMYSEEVTPVQDVQLSMGSGNNDKETTLNNLNKNNDNQIINDNEENLDNSVNENSLAAIMKKREGQGMKQWNALKQTLKDRKIDILEMVRTHMSRVIIVF